MRKVRQPGLHPGRQRKVVGLHALLLACFGLCGSIQAVERDIVGGTIIVYHGSQTQKVDFAPKTAPAPLPLPLVVQQRPSSIPPVLAPVFDDLPQRQLLTHGKRTSDQSWIGPNVLRVSEQAADIGLTTGATVHRTDPVPELKSKATAEEPVAEPAECEPVKADNRPCEPAKTDNRPCEPVKTDNRPSDPAVQPPLHLQHPQTHQPHQTVSPATFIVWPPAVQQAFEDHHRPDRPTALAPHPAVPGNGFSTLEIVALSVGISFVLSFATIWLVVITVQRSLPQQVSTASQNEPLGNHDPPRAVSATAFQNTAPAPSPDRHRAAAQRETHVVDLADDVLAMAPVAAEYQQRRQEEQQRSKT